MKQSDSEKQTAPPSVAQQRRSVVDRATGVVMAQFGIEREDAFNKLAAMAVQNQRPLVDVAREILREDEFGRQRAGGTGAASPTSRSNNPRKSW